MDSPYKMWTCKEDGRMHAFFEPERSLDGYVEAVCGYRAPPGQLDKPGTGPLHMGCVEALTTVPLNVAHGTPAAADLPGGGVDRIRDWPNPDWDNPQDYDGPTDIETAMIRRLQATVTGIQEWVAYAYEHGTVPEAWTELGARLVAIGKQCIDLPRTVKGEIT